MIYAVLSINPCLIVRFTIDYLDQLDGPILSNFIEGKLGDRCLNLSILLSSFSFFPSKIYSYFYIFSFYILPKITQKVSREGNTFFYLYMTCNTISISIYTSFFSHHHVYIISIISTITSSNSINTINLDYICNLFNSSKQPFSIYIYIYMIIEYNSYSSYKDI
jgi:hypothetical protein